MPHAPQVDMDELLKQWDRLDNAIKRVRTAQLDQVGERVALLEQERAEMHVLIMQLARASFAAPQKS